MVHSRTSRFLFLLWLVESFLTVHISLSKKKPCVLNKVNRGRQSVCRGPSSNRPPHRSTQIQDKESESDLTTEMDRADLRHVVLWRVLMTTTSYVHLNRGCLSISLVTLSQNAAPGAVLMCLLNEPEDNPEQV